MCCRKVPFSDPTLTIFILRYNDNTDGKLYLLSLRLLYEIKSHSKVKNYYSNRGVKSVYDMTIYSLAFNNHIVSLTKHLSLFKSLSPHLW